MATFAQVMEEFAFAEASLVELRSAMLYEEGIRQSNGLGHIPQADVDAFNRARSQLAQNLTRALSQFQDMLAEASLPSSIKDRIRSYLGETDWGLQLLDRVPPIKMRDDGRLGLVPAIGAYTTAQAILAGVIAISLAAGAIAISAAIYRWATAAGQWAEADTQRTLGRAAQIKAVADAGGTPDQINQAGRDFDKGNPPPRPPDLPGVGDFTTLIAVGVGAYLLFQLMPSIKAVAEGETARRYRSA